MVKAWVLSVFLPSAPGTARARKKQVTYDWRMVFTDSCPMQGNTGRMAWICVFWILALLKRWVPCNETPISWWPGPSGFWWWCCCCCCCWWWWWRYISPQLSLVKQATFHVGLWLYTLLKHFLTNQHSHLICVSPTTADLQLLLVVVNKNGFQDVLFSIANNSSLTWTLVCSWWYDGFSLGFSHYVQWFRSLGLSCCMEEVKGLCASWKNGPIFPKKNTWRFYMVQHFFLGGWKCMNDSLGSLYDVVLVYVGRNNYIWLSFISNFQFALEEETPPEQSEPHIFSRKSQAKRFPWVGRNPHFGGFASRPWKQSPVTDETATFRHSTIGPDL